MNIRRPPYRSVSAPNGMRSSDPSTTGTAVSSSVRVFERSRVSWNFFASGAIRLQALNETANATVASSRARVAPGRATHGGLRTCHGFEPTCARGAGHRGRAAGSVGSSY